MSKLTLSIDKETVDGAKHFAALHDTSVSKLVKRFLKDLDRGGEEDFFARLHDSLKREGYRAPAGDVDNLRRRHVERKYSPKHARVRC